MSDSDKRPPGIGPQSYHLKKWQRRTQHFPPPVLAPRNRRNPGGTPTGSGNPGIDSPPASLPTEAPTITPVYSTCKDTFSVFFGIVPGLKRYVVQHSAHSTGPWKFYCFQRRERDTITFNNYFGGQRWIRVNFLGLDLSTTLGIPFKPDAPNVAPPALSVPGLNPPLFPLPPNYSGASGADETIGVLVTSDLEQVDYYSAKIMKVPVANSAIIEATKRQYHLTDVSSPQTPRTMAVTVTGGEGDTLKFTTDGSDPTATHGSDSGTVIDPSAAGFGCVVIARAFNGGCASPPVYLLIDKQIGFTNHINTTVGSKVGSASCQRSGHHKPCQPSPPAAPMTPGPALDDPSTCMDLYKTDDPAAIILLVAKNIHNTIGGGSVAREIFVDAGFAGITGATLEPNGQEGTENLICGPGYFWSDGTLTVNISSQNVADIHFPEDAGTEAMFASFPDALTCAYAYQNNDSLPPGPGIWNGPWLDRLTYTLFGPNRVGFGSSQGTFNLTSGTQGQLYSCAGFLSLQALISWLLEKPATPYYIADLELVCTLAATVASDIWNIDDVISLTPPAPPPPPPPGPSISGVTTTTPSGSYPAGESIDITVTFTANVNVAGGTPDLYLNVGAYAVYSSGSGTNQLTFVYTVAPGQDAAPLDYVNFASVVLAGSTIKDDSGNNAQITLPVLPGLGLPGSLSGSAAIVIDTTAPAVSNVTSTLPNNTYGAGQVVPVLVQFTEPVFVTGTPHLTMETGTSDTVAVYSLGSGTNTLVFDYTIAGGDTSADLDYHDTAALSLNSGTIKDLAGNGAVLTLPTPGDAGSLSANKAIVIDAVPPTVINVTSTLVNDTYGTGQGVPIQVQFSKPVVVTGNPKLTLETGVTDEVANYSGVGTGTDTLTLVYSVVDGDTSADLDYHDTAAFSLNGGTIQDLLGNVAVLTLPAPGAAGSLSYNKNIVIATSPPPPTNDVNLWAWYRSDTGVTKDGSNKISGTPCWADQSGLGHSFEMTSAGNEPTWDAGGPNSKPMIKFGLTANSTMHTHTGLTFNQPVSVFLLIYIPSWQSGKWLHDGYNSSSMGMAMYPSTGNMSLWAGGAAWTCTFTPWTFGSWHVLTAIYDGASSTLQMDNGTPATGNPGTNAPGGVSLGAVGAGACPLFNVAAAIYHAGHADAGTQLLHKNWLAWYGGITL